MLSFYLEKWLQYREVGMKSTEDQLHFDERYFFCVGRFSCIKEKGISFWLTLELSNIIYFFELSPSLV